MPEIKVTDEQGNTHVFPDGSTPQMIAKAMHVRVQGDKGLAPKSTVSALQNATVSARPPGVTTWLEDIQSDVSHGTGLTFPGRVLSAMGAPGTERGVPPQVAEMMPGGGTIQGAAKMGHGIGRAVQGHPILGGNEAMQGFMQAVAPVAAMNPAFLPTMVAYGVGGAAINKGLTAVGVDPDTAEFIQNVILMKGGKDIIEGAIRKTTGRDVDLLKLPKEQIKNVAVAVRDHMTAQHTPKGKHIPAPKRAVANKRQEYLANSISETASGSGIDPQTSAKAVEPWLRQAAADNPSVLKVITDRKNPVDSLKGQYAMYNLAETALEKQYQGVVDRHPNLKTQLISIKNLWLQADPILEEVLGKDTTGINDMFRSINKPHTFAEWDNMRRKLGELSKKTYDSAPGSDSVLNQVAALRKAADVVRNGLYDQVQEITKEDLRPLKSAQGYLIEHKWDLYKSTKGVGAEHQLATGPAPSKRAWVARWMEASGDKGGIGIPGAGHLFKRWMGTKAERIQGNLRNFYRDLPDATPEPKGEPGQPGATFTSRQNPTPSRPGLPAGARQAQIPTFKQLLLGPPAPAPFMQTPPFNPGTAKMKLNPSRLEAAQAAQAADAPASRGFTVDAEGKAVPVPAGQLPGKVEKGPAPRPPNKGKGKYSQSKKGKGKDSQSEKGPAPRPQSSVVPQPSPSEQSEMWSDETARHYG